MLKSLYVVFCYFVPLLAIDTGLFGSRVHNNQLTGLIPLLNVRALQYL